MLILGGFATASDVGVYSVALTLTGDRVGAAAGVADGRLPAGREPRRVRRSRVTVSAEEADAALAKAIRHGVLLTVPAGAHRRRPCSSSPCRCSTAPKFHETIALGFVLLPAVLVLGVAKILSSAIAGRGYPRYTLYVGAISAPLTLALYFTLIPPFDAWGAAVASAVSYVLTSAAHACVLPARDGHRLPRSVRPDARRRRRLPASSEARP